MNRRTREAEGKREKLKTWLKNPYNFLFVLVMIVAVLLRLYYFFLTKNQPLWWDESDYLAYAKNLAGYNVNWIVTAKHNSLFPFLVAALFKIGLEEEITKFILQITSSILTVLLTYLISIEMYKDKRIGLIASMLMATFWVHLFNSMRFHVGIPALLFGLASIWIFWKGYEKKEKILGMIDPRWSMPIVAFLVVLTYSIRRGYFLFGVFIAIHLLTTKRITELIKDKYNWIALAVGLILLFLTEKFIFISGIGSVASSYTHTEKPINFFTPLGVFPSYFNSLSSLPSVLLYLFWLGIILGLYSIFISFETLRAKKYYETRSDWFNLIAIICTLLFFALVLRVDKIFGEPRWYLPLAFSSFIFVARGATFIADTVGTHNKKIANIVLAALVISGAYYELQHADMIIKAKIPSFEGIKQAGLFLKETASDDDIILVVPVPQTAYYSEKPNVININQFVNWTGNNYEMPFELALEKIKETPEAKYLIVTFSEPNHPYWMKKPIIAQDPSTGQQRLAGWQIPFMNSTILSNKQDIKQEVSYGNITFKLLTIKQDALVYEIIRSRRV